MINKTAIVLGATGLIGKHLVNILIADDTFSIIKIIVRRPAGFNSNKVEEHIINFEEIASIKKLVTGDVLFSCLGTTLKQAGSKDAQFKVDYTYQYEVARMAAQNSVPEYFLVSSSGANSKSRIFYTRMKGELDDAVLKLPFSRIRIFRPSLLLGERQEKRTGESIGGVLNSLIKMIPFINKYRGINGSTVAQAMVNTFKDENPKSPLFYQLDEIFKLI